MAAIDHCLPPTTNTLEPLQRQRLLKSTQKVSALLGTTPLVLEQGMDTTRSPSVRADRRQGKVFYNHAQFASSSKTSLSSDASDSPVWVPSPKQDLRDGYQHHKCSSMPITVQFPGKTSGHHHSPTKLKTNPSFITSLKPLSQPILYRMRSKPVSAPVISPLSSPLPPSASMPRKSSITSNTGNVRRKGDLTEIDRRKKMAKLVRTLGENIPPELVFGGAAPSAISHPPQRSTSLRKGSNTVASQPLAGQHQQRPRNESGEFSDLPVESPIVFRITKTVEECSSPVPTSDPTSTLSSSTCISTSISTSSIATVIHSPDSKHRKHRPRSLTLGSFPLNNIIIEQDDDICHTPRRNRSCDIPSPRSDDIGNPTTTSIEVVEYGKRKEKEWSGEWNVKDMAEVAKALRGLRRR
ncbi:hypothetical protein AGABI1DRAFT_105045 [Agaricus bisporus var. burnettii JB137-S8]|uniref:Uncharacterized protein n=2 Tax=Agaricus bisporus var. burnettii TaxID=192524 RepID=K5Y0Z7_AGABU|nr:uncharacterized protein AGABI1DRAFT_105045 [Agaricus bisporus var. burnettii JB137-S8]EKM81465.1 hypothetical protein AGABI1DRAFT_105045 [Agaricus bisporus var. burnettii JB137-S8]KAF7770236.1 hypothetical protein Agabi119p4_6210 [Agaricus bisporus var. burnettii]